MCSEAGSFDLTGAKLGSAIQEMLAAVEIALVKRDSEGQTHAQVILPTICIPDRWLCSSSPCSNHAIGLQAAQHSCLSQMGYAMYQWLATISESTYARQDGMGLV